jgi:hypothetical protein
VHVAETRVYFGLSKTRPSVVCIWLKGNFKVIYIWVIISHKLKQIFYCNIVTYVVVTDLSFVLQKLGHSYLPLRPKTVILIVIIFYSLHVPFISSLEQSKEIYLLHWAPLMCCERILHTALHFVKVSRTSETKHISIQFKYSGMPVTGWLPSVLRCLI